jgi:hypothetical protein
VARHIYSKFPECHWLWWESDATPICEKWIETLDKEYKRAGKKFMGHIVSGMGDMNGVAVYPHNVPDLSYNAMLARASSFDVVLRDETISETHAANHLIAHKPRFNGTKLTFDDHLPLLELQHRGFVCFMDATMALCMTR